MTLSQRLTRAGLTFVLLGTVAVALPQQSGAARADVCTIGGNTLKIVQGTLSSGSSSPTFTQTSASQAYTSFFNTTQAGAITTTTSAASFTSSGDGTSQVTLTKSGTPGTATLNDTFTDTGGVVYNASATVSY